MVESLIRTSDRCAGTPVVLISLSLATLIGAVWRIRLSLGHMMWLDELYTTTLIGAANLPHLWNGAVRGVDGNPPLYMMLAWVLTSMWTRSPDLVLRALNLVCVTGTAVLAYRMGRRLAQPLPVAAALAVLPGVDGFADFALTEVRTYALYLFLVTANLFLTLRVVDRPTRGRSALLAGIGVLATLAHSFGGFYVLATAVSAGAVCFVARDRKLAATLAWTAVPATLALAGWIVVSMPAQMAVASPYGWIPRPDLLVLATALTGSLLMTSLVAVGLPGAVAILAWEGNASRMYRHRSVAVLGTVLIGYAALTLAGWLGSHVITPFFVPRYFIPNLLVAVLALVVVAEYLSRHVRPGVACGAFALCAFVGVSTVARDGDAGPIPCRNAQGHFIESQHALLGLPVIAESPGTMLTRIHYAPEQETFYPLDWQVVLDYPYRARNNAMDYHIMDILRDWAPSGSNLAMNVLTTEELLARHGHFLVLDEMSRAWFDALRVRSSVAAVLVDEGPGCRLWDVRVLSSSAASNPTP